MTNNVFITGGSRGIGAAAVLEIYRQRAVRIFRGKERYIIEE